MENTSAVDPTMLALSVPAVGLTPPSMSVPLSTRVEPSALSLLTSVLPVILSQLTA